jgi:N-acyl-D-amino-acid deacylase
MSAGQPSFMGEEVEWTWLSFDEYLTAVESVGLSMNTVHLVGHTPLRTTVMGGSAQPATPEDLEAMALILEEALEQGGAGFSTGLIYPPGSFATTEELICLSRVAARHGRGYYTHIRNEGDQLLEAVDEAIRIGRESGAAVEIAHHKAGGRPNWGKVHNSTAAMERACAEGCEVRFDVYPYLAGSTTLTAQLPDFAHEGGRSAMLARLSDPAERRRIVESLMGNPHIGGQEEEYFSSIMVSSVSTEQDRDLEGMTVSEIAQAQGKGPIDATLDLLLAHGGRVSSVNFGMCEEDMEFVLSHPLAAVGSDASSISAVNGKLYGKPHPRGYGTFPRVLGQLARDKGLMPLHEALRKMTSEPARRLGLPDRGVLREGAWADVVVFDPATIGDQATYQDPHRFPDGIAYVFVNGDMVVGEGRHTSCRPGRVLRFC